jgi:hypothetical protein
MPGTVEPIPDDLLLDSDHVRPGLGDADFIVLADPDDDPSALIA